MFPALRRPFLTLAPRASRCQSTARRRLPLEDVRVLAVEQFGAGPFGSLMLADLGAEIIKIEDPATKGDIARHVPSPLKKGEDNVYFESFNRNKKSVSLDLLNPVGKKVFHEMVKKADAVYSNLRGDVPKKLGIDYESLKGVNEKIVCVSLSAFGQTGPRVKSPGYDPVVQALCGWMDVTGDNVPTKSGLSLADYAGGTVAALALVSGLHAARRDGIGMDCDLSLYDTAMHFVGYPATYALTTGYKPKRMKRSAHPTLIPFQAVPTQDGWAVLAVAKEKFWHRLAEALQKPEWLTDPRFVNFAARDANREFVVDAIEAETAKYPTATLIPLLESHGVPCGPVNSIPESLKDPHFAARDLLIEYEHDTLGDVKMVASPVKIGGIKAEPKRGPRRGEHNEEMLKELGFSSDEVDRLKKEGAFGGAKKKVEDDD